MLSLTKRLQLCIFQLLLFFQRGLLTAQRGAFFRESGNLFFQRIAAGFVGIRG